MATAQLGQRIQEIRKRRGLTQRELAALAGVSVSLVRKLEQGEREDTRVETLRKLAEALHVPTSELITRAPSGPPRDTGLWGPLKDALMKKPNGSPEEPPSVAGVRQALDAVMPLFSGDRYSELATVLPPLVRDAEALGAEGRAVRGRLLHHIGWLFTQTREFDAAEMALARALDHASDRIDSAATVSTHAWLLIRQGRFDDTLQLAQHWADEVEPRMSRATAADLSAWGWLLIRISSAAIRDNQPGEADDAIRLARTAAVAMGAEYAPPGEFLRSFGALTVAMKRTEIAMIEDRPDRVVAMSRRIPLDDLRPTSNNRNRHLLDLAKAHVRLRHHSDAFDLLCRVRNDAPEWIANQRLAGDVLGEIIGRRRTLTSDMREMADFLHLDL